MKITKQLYLYVFIITALFCFSCEQERIEPILTTAPGGGNITAFKAYTIDSIPGISTVYGRVVFWEQPNGQTLVQAALHNTIDGIMHPAMLMSGTTASGGSTVLTQLYDVNGATGEFATHKFYVIADTDFFDNLDTYDAHFSVQLSSIDPTIVATGDVGINATPVESSE